MRAHWMLLGVAFVVLGAPGPARSILIELGPKNRVGGFLIDQDATTLFIRVRMPDGKEVERQYEKAKVKIIHQVNRERLAKLSNENPKAYLDYAQELAGQTADPEAVETAKRLFLIAAHLDAPQFGRTSLLAMSSLAATPAEARKYRALAFLLDASADAGLLKNEVAKTAPAPGPETKQQANALRDFQMALRYYRTGQVQSAKDYAKHDGVEKYFSLAPGMMDQKSFAQACTDALCTSCRGKATVKCSACNGTKRVMGPFGQLEFCETCKSQGKSLGFVKCSECDGTGVNQNYSEEQLRITLRGELWALDQLAGAAKSKQRSGETSWSSILQARELAPVPVLRLESISDFDPRQCLYRKGVWLAPGEAK